MDFSPYEIKVSLAFGESRAALVIEKIDNELRKLRPDSLGRSELKRTLMTYRNDRKNRVDPVPVAWATHRGWLGTRAVARTMAIAAPVLAGCANTVKRPTTLEKVGWSESGYALGCLSHRTTLGLKVHPDGLRFFPAPSAKESAEERVDEGTFQRLKALRMTPRGAIAFTDADLKSADVIQAFSCALSVPITQEETPYLNMLLRQSLNDAALATFTAKDRYRPGDAAN